MQDNIQSITKLAIRRLAQCGKVKLTSGFIFQETQGVLKVFLENVIRDVVTYVEHAKCKNVTTMDVIYVPMPQGCTLNEFGGSMKVEKNPTVYL